MRKTILSLFFFSFLFTVAWQQAQAQEPSAEAEQKAFAKWLETLKLEAQQKGISRTTLESAFYGIAPVARIIELDRKQPEDSISLEKYLKSVVPSQRVRKGKRLLEENKVILEEIAKTYNVQPRFIVALWGIESDFGDYTGNFYIPEALATLAYDGRRSDFFRQELLNALQILEEQHIDTKNMKGSWAGAMGQSQFMPSTFLSYAVDYNNDGHKDIWQTRSDIYASIANYLGKLGWDNERTWGRHVRLPKGFDKKLADIKITKPITEWQKLGVRKHNGADLPVTRVSASLVLPDDNPDYAYLVYDNYKRILKWNRSLYFATAVGYLSDALR